MNEQDLGGAFAAGNLALDLLNTVPTANPERSDGLESPHSLQRWMESVQLFPDPDTDSSIRHPPAARILLGEARSLREQVSLLVEACRAGEALPAHALYGLDRCLGASRRSATLSSGEDGLLRVVDVETARDPLALLAPIARAAAVLLASADPARIRRCPSDSCGRWFLDTSKGGRRKWCSMAICGNRAKAAGHRRRRATA